VEVESRNLAGSAPEIGHCLAVYICTYQRIVDCEWGPVKAKANVTKHGIHFADAVSGLEDDSALTIPDPYFEEERWITLGMDALGRVLVVIYTWRGEKVRLISARQERRKYDEGHEARIRFQPRQTRTCHIGSKGQDQNHNPTGRRCARLVSPTGGSGWRKLSDFNQRCAAAANPSSSRAA